MVSALQLKNYRSHAATSIMFAPFNLLLGAMGSGKSSILHALALLLCGQYPLINKKSEGLEREIREGEEEFRIAVKLSDGMLIDQKKVRGGKNFIGVNGSYIDVRQQRGIITGAIGRVGADCIQAQLDPYPFFQREEKEQRAVLLQLMATQELPAPPLVRKLGLAESFSSVGQVNQLITEIKEVKIRGLNRDIATLQAQIPDQVEFSPAKMAETRARIETFRRQSAEAKRKEGADQEWNRIAVTLTADLEAVKAEGSVESLVQKLDVAQKRKALADEKVKELRVSYAKKQEVHNEKKQQLAVAEAFAKKTEEIMATLSGLAGACPTCLRALPAKEKEKLLKDQSDQLALVKHNLAAYKSAVEAAQRECNDMVAKADEYKKAMGADDSEIASLQRKIDLHDDLLQQISKHKANKQESGNWPKELADAASGLASAEIDLAAMTEAQQANSRRIIQVAQVVAKQTEAADLLSAVGELAEMKDTLLQQGSGGFVEIMRSVLVQFGFKTVEYSSEPFGFFCDGLLPDQMSGGQKVLVEAALRLAAAKTSSLNLMALDDANKMGESARNKLAQVLATSGVQCIVCSTTELEPKPMKLPLGMSVFFFTNPTTTGPTTVKQVAAAEAAA